MSCVAPLALLLAPGFSVEAFAAEPAGLAVRQVDGKLRVEAGGDLFTEVDLAGYRKPICYPIHGPAGTSMTRHYPMRRDVPGEARDHVHHKSMWFAHGDINGVSFWDEKGQVRSLGWSRITPNSISWKSEWLSPSGERVCTDETTLTFLAEADRRVIDWDVTTKALGVPLVFGDTKEGMMAIRTHPRLNLENEPDPQGRVIVGQAVNSEGVRGKSIWGKRARWVDYSGTIDGRDVGIAVLDHVENPRHPTYWHAREYGLVAANPFGVSQFEGQGNGALTVPAGESIRFRYRFVFYTGESSAERVERWWSEYTGADDAK